MNDNNDKDFVLFLFLLEWGKLRHLKNNKARYVQQLPPILLIAKISFTMHSCDSRYRQKHSNKRNVEWMVAVVADSPNSCSALQIVEPFVGSSRLSIHQLVPPSSFESFRFL
ncbi:hypothetical protein AVEN_201217-1 [Araneus ventricosus]|uniref:Uncharacterized protein n=1 Tax=Araneus ventricosus TaxID=182803 RepID=A0A4Y2HPH8_ARAVE|nr:hypothetical protein AVEN_201217-1 [Araneus ventricosus]